MTAINDPLTSFNLNLVKKTGLKYLRSMSLPSEERFSLSNFETVLKNLF